MWGQVTPAPVRFSTNLGQICHKYRTRVTTHRERPADYHSVHNGLLVLVEVIEDRSDVLWAQERLPLSKRA